METPTSRQGSDPARADDRALHARLLAGDPTAPADFADAHLEPLAAWLARQPQFRNVDGDLLMTVAIDLVLALPLTPRRYDPDRGGLAAYLRMAARADVLNALASERRRTGRQVPLKGVELSSEARNISRAGEVTMAGPADPAEIVAGGGAMSVETLALLRSSFDDVEWQVVQLMAEGERRTDAFARVLNLGDRSEIDRAREVKRVKDRLQKRLRRLAPKVRRDE